MRASFITFKPRQEKYLGAGKPEFKFATLNKYELPPHPYSSSLSLYLLFLEFKFATDNK